MKNNWTKTVNTLNRERFTIPAGWDTREQVSEQLQCAPDRVGDLLKPGIHAGKIEKRMFPVWDENRRMAIPTACYRVIPEGTVEEPKVKPAKKGKSKDPEWERVERAILRDPSAPNYLIAKNNRSTAPFVAQVRASM